MMEDQFGNIPGHTIFIKFLNLQRPSLEVSLYLKSFTMNLSRSKFSVAFFFFFLFLLSNLESKAQQKEKKFFISAGYGLAGSFSVRTYNETLPFPSAQYGNFSNKNFIGNAQQFNVGYRLSKNYQLNAGIHFQRFTRRVKVTDTLVSVVIYLDNTINEKNYIYFANLSRVFEGKKNLWQAGLGLYYIRPQSQSIEYGRGIPNFFLDYERRYDNSKLEEGGAFIEFAYEYKFQPRVNIGMKGQFYYTLSAGYAESVALFPYVKILF